MIDEIYSVSDISTDDNQIAIDTLNQTFVISAEVPLLDRGEIQIEESFFFVPGTDAVTNEVSFEIPNEGIESPPPTATTYELSDLVDLTQFGDCLPYSALEGFSPEFTSESIPIYGDLEFDYVESIDSIRITSGQISLSATNNFPFEIEELEIRLEEDFNGSTATWESLSVENLSSSQTDQDIVSLTQRRLPASIASEPSIIINDDGSGNPSPCQFWVQVIPNPGFPIPDITEVTCTEDLLAQFPELADALVIWDDGNDGNGIDECWIYYEGWSIDGSEAISVEVDFTIDEMYDIWGHIVFETDTTVTQSISVMESISLMSAHIADIASSDTNKIKINVENGLFTPVDIELSIENILNSSGQPLTYQTTIDTDSTVDDEIDLSDKEIRDSNYGFLEELVINNKISFDSENTQIKFGEEYTLNINEISTTPMQFDELYVYLQDFSTPPIDMANVPAGFGDIGLPTLQFNLYLYNEIDAPLTLNLDLRGVTEDATPIEIHVEPELKFPDNYDGIDTTVISIYSDTLEVQGTGFTDYYQLEARIDTLFSRDEIEVSGNAILNGESSLRPGKSFWGDVGIEIRPLTIVFPEDVTFSPQQKTELSLDEGTRENIDDGLVEAELFIEVGNSMPIGATLNMLTSNQDFFPLCFDTLRTGLANEQTISDTCLTLIQENYSPDSIYVSQDDNGEFVYSEFINSTDTVFVGRLLALDLGIPTNLDENGFILEKDVTYNNLILDTTKMGWLTSNDLLYISPVINDVRTSIDTLPGYVTFHTIDYLQIKSFLTLMMDSRIITGSEDEE